MDKFNEVFSKRLKGFMDAFGMTQKELAKKMNVSETSVSNWILGSKVPRADKVDMLCSIFNCKRSDFLEDEPKPIINPVLQQHIEMYSQLSSEHQNTIDELISALQEQEPDSGKLLEVIGKITTFLHS